ncbi:MAG: hypothetical protein ACPG5P_09225 [Saprospiraceae bacterium]
MKYLVFAILAIGITSIVLISCKSTKNTDTTKVGEETAKEVTGTEGEVKERKKLEIKGIYGTWRLMRINDAYTGKWQDYMESKVITIREDRVYTEKTTDNPLCEGKYEAQEENMLAVTHSCNKAVLMYKVVSTKDNKLILGIQGRHGMVQYEYKPSR